MNIKNMIPGKLYMFRHTSEDKTIIGILISIKNLYTYNRKYNNFFVLTNKSKIEENCCEFWTAEELI